MNDIFSQFGDIFGNPFGGAFTNQRPRRGNDLRVQMQVSLEEILTGTTKKVKYKRQHVCSPCNGKGGTDVRTCTSCGGQGVRTMTQQTPFGSISQTVPCNHCGGQGSNITNRCSQCSGSGTVAKDETVDINIPKGVGSGMSLNMNGYGNHVKDGQPGDLHVLIDEMPHPRYKREGNNLICEETISISDAVLGTNLKVETLHGESTLQIFGGCESGFCQMPLGIKRTGYRKYDKNSKPLCHGAAAGKCKSDYAFELDQFQRLSTNLHTNFHK
jgi:molecular chaperone DnaJ